MTLPRFAGKHDEESLFTPADFLAYARAHAEYPERVGPGAILLYQNRFARALIDAGRIEAIGGSAYHRVVGHDGICVRAGFGIGAPVMAVTVEETIALGATQLVGVGTAGTLQPRIGIGDLVVCTGAVRDEGVSHHYLDAAEPARPSAGLTDAVRDALAGAGLRWHEGESWTIDAPYRETVAEARHYRDAGVATVDMEASAMFAVAAYREVESAAVFAISDSLSELRWDPRFHSDDTQQGLARLFDAAVAALA